MYRAKDPNQVNAHSKRFSGVGKSLDLPPDALENALSGEDALEGVPDGVAGERGTKPYKMDGSYNGNVQGPMFKTFG